MSAESREDAERLFEGGPIISSVRLCEAMTVWRVAAVGGSSVGSVTASRTTIGRSGRPGGM